MSEVILFIGLPGSGKSYWINKLCNVVIDDITQLPIYLNPTDILGISDPYFCRKESLKNPIILLNRRYPNATISFVFFENIIEKTRTNVDGQSVNDLIQILSKTYFPDEIIPVDTINQIFYNEPIEEVKRYSKNVLRVLCFNIKSCS